jgi:hypothetical protein
MKAAAVVAAVAVAAAAVATVICQILHPTKPQTFTKKGGEKSKRSRMKKRERERERSEGGGGEGRGTSAPFRFRWCPSKDINGWRERGHLRPQLAEVALSSTYE